MSALAGQVFIMAGAVESHLEAAKRASLPPEALAEIEAAIEALGQLVKAAQVAQDTEDGNAPRT